MRRRRWLIATALATLLAAGAALAWLVISEPHISANAYAQIELGMSREQVEAILGPPGNYGGHVRGPVTLQPWESPRSPEVDIDYIDGDGHRICFWLIRAEPDLMDVGRMFHQAEWTGDRYQITVSYHKNFHVARKCLGEHAQFSWLTRLLARIGIR